MATELRTEITLPAPPERVWEVLTDFEKYGEWNPFITHAAGRARVGERLDLRIAGTGFKPTVLVADPGRELRWLGRLFLPRLFDGEHYFQLSPAPGGQTRLVHGELFSGILVPLFRRKLLGETRQGFERLNQALRDRVA